MRSTHLVAIPLALVTATAALAQPPAAPPAAGRGGQPAAPPARRIEAALAREAVEAAIAACAAQSLRVSAAVSDAAGNPIYVFVPDGVGARTGDTAVRKNITVTTTGKAASQTAALAAADPVLEGKLAAPGSRLVRFGGAVPIMAGGTLVGAIGASGATAAQDETCAQAGLDKIAARVK
jgi:uncharacterized protein GlcG (DUF336 family)